MKTKTLLGLMFSAVLGLSACGGGGGNTGGSAGGGGGSGGGSGGGGSGGGGGATPRVETVIQTGNIFAISGYDALEDLIAEAIAEINAIQARGQDLINGIHGGGPISYVIGRRTSHVSFPSYERKRNGLIPILQTGGTRAHAVAGQYKNQFGRFSFFGSSPPVLFNNGENLGFEPAFQRLLAWLLGDDPGVTTALSGTTLIVLARNHNTGILQAWLETNLPNATVTICDNATALATCTAGADLLVIGKNGNSALANSDASEIDRLLRINIPVLYLHGSLEHPSAGSTAYSALIGANFPQFGNYFLNDPEELKERNSEWPNANSMIVQIGADNAAVAATLDHVDRGNFGYNFSAGLDGNTVDRDAVPGYQEEFGRAASYLRTLFNTLDDNQFSVFAEDADDFRLERILALIGDALRQDVIFPMDILTSDQQAFLASYLADHMVYGFRQINPLQPDRGFHGKRSHNQVTPGNYTATINTRFTGRKPTGAYALPGKAFTVTRTDSNADVNVEIYWNLQFPGGTFEFRTGSNRYDMPKYLRSQEINLAPGERITVSSPYGGVIQIRHGRGSNNAQNVVLAFQGVGQHPFYNGPATAASFSNGLAAGVYDWAEIAAPEHYVTEPLEMMRTSVQRMADDLGWDINEVARVGSRYYYNEMARLSGYRGFDVPAQPAEVAAFCAANGWECANDDYHGINGSVEGNIRQSITNCGSFGGCSNQPVTYTWSWNPLGAGPVHERGHHLERNSGADFHRFAPLHNHALTNIWRNFLPFDYYRTTGNIGACGVQRNDLRNNGIRFQILQDAQNSGNVQQHMADNVWNAGQQGTFSNMMSMQFAAHAEDQGNLTDGWNYFPLLLIAAREFENKLDEGQAAFDAAKARYGFGQFSFADAQAMIATDDGQRSWALIAYSFITGRDQRNYWRMLGWDFSTQANQQMNALFPGFPLSLTPPAAMQFYAFDDVCSIDNAIAVPVDGTTAWPENRPTVFTSSATLRSTHVHDDLCGHDHD